MIQKQIGLSFRLAHTTQYAWADLTNRLTMTFLNIFAVGVIVAMFLIVGFYAATIYRREQSEVADQLSPAIAATVRDVADSANRFTAKRMQELERLPGVARGSVFPKVEIDVKVSLDSAKVEHVRLEGAVPGQTDLDKHRLSWGRSLTKDSQQEVVLGEPLFRKLGGQIVGSAPNVREVVIEVSRTANRQTQIHRQTCSLVGLVRRQRQDKVHVPLQMAMDLDLWCMNKIDALEADTTALASNSRSAALFAYVPIALTNRVDEECRQYGIHAEQRDQITTLEATGEIWATVRSTTGEQPSLEQTAWLRDLSARQKPSASGSPGFDVWSESWFDLASADPGRSGGSPLRAVGLNPSDPRWQELSRGLEKPATRIFLASDVSPADRSSCEVVLHLKDQSLLPTSQNSMFSSKAACIGLRETLEQIAFDPDRSARPITVVTTRSIDLARKLQREYHVKFDPERAIHDVDFEIIEYEFRGVIEGDASSCRQRIRAGAADGEWREYSALPLTLKVHGEILATWIVADDRAASSETAAVFVGDRLNQTDHIRLQVSNGDAPNVKLVPSSHVPRGLAFADRVLFHRLAYELASETVRRAASTHETFLVRVEDVLQFLRARDQFASRGMMLQPLVPLREEKLVEYAITDPESTDGSVDAQLLRVLAMTKPTFAQVFPFVSVPAKMVGVDLTLLASSASDPRRFAHPPISGHWLRDGDGATVVIPAAVAKKLAPLRSPESWIGKSIDVSFQRGTRLNAVEPDLKLPLTIVGVSDGDAALIPCDLAAKLTLWREGLVMFRNDRQTFEAPVETYTRVGHVRCNLEAVDLNHVADVVAKLEVLGYTTEHQLATQEGLRRLGWLLSTSVIALALLMAVFPWITVLVTSWMSIDSKTHEIGILKSHGVSRFEIGRLYAVEASFIGLAAFVAGSCLVIFIEPMVRNGIAMACGGWLPFSLGEVFTTPITAASMRWLFAMALPAALGTTLTGVLIPAWWASGLKPVEAFRRRQ